MVPEKNRRTFIHRCLTLVCLGIISCQNQPKQKQINETDPMDCDDLSSTPHEELTKRENLGYAYPSPMPDKNCKTCNLFIPSSETKPCPGCMLFKGPVKEGGYCTYWAPII